MWELNKNRLFFLVLSICSLSAHAKNPPQWDMIPEQSQLSFKATQGENKLSANFTRFNGTIYVEPVNYKASYIQISIDMQSLVSEDSNLVSTLSQTEWFNTINFPHAEFTSTKFNKLADKTYQADGNLVIKAKSVPVTLVFTAQEVKPGYAVVEGDTIVKASDFGLNATTEDFKDEVSIYFKIVARRRGPIPESEL